MDEQKLIDLQDEYSSALAQGNQDRVKDLEKQLDEYITQGTLAESTPETPVENTDPASEPATEQPEAVETSPSPEDTTEGEPAPTQETSETEDWLNSLDPKIRENVQKLIEDREKLEHQYKATNGRVAAYQRRYEEQRKLAVQQEELIKKLKSSTAQMPQGNQPTAAPKPTNTPLSIDDDPDLKDIAATDEQLARTILKREQLLRQEIDRLQNTIEERLSPLQQRFEEASINSEMDRLLSVVPNAVEVFNSKEWDDWVSTQPSAIKAIALSDKADEALRALELYAADMQRWYPQQPQAPQQGQPVASNPDPRASKVQQERERKLQAQPVGSASVRPPQKAEPTLEEIMNDPELLEKHQQMLYKKELERMGKAHLA